MYVHYNKKNVQIIYGIIYFENLDEKYWFALLFIFENIRFILFIIYLQTSRKTMAPNYTYT